MIRLRIFAELESDNVIASRNDTGRYSFASQRIRRADKADGSQTEATAAVSNGGRDLIMRLLKAMVLFKVRPVLPSRPALLALH